MTNPQQNPDAHGVFEDPSQDPNYQRWIEELAKHCRCSCGPCDGLMSGGICDEIVDPERDRDDDLDLDGNEPEQIP